MIETEIVTTTTYESIGAVTGLPDTLDKGQSAVITAELTTTNPYGDINFSIFNPLGFDDVFNIGYPQIASLGTSYECNNVSKWVPTMQKSISGLSVGKVDFDLTAVINVDMTRNISNEENKMVIKFPITAMKGFTEGQYAFTVAMKVGTEDVITVTQDIIITDTEHSPTISSGDITLGTPTSLSTVYAGGAAAFQIDINVPAGKSFGFDITGTITGTEVDPLGFYIKNPGLCSGFNQEALPATSKTVDGSSFGTVTNADSADTTIQLMVVLKLSDAATGAVNEKISIDGIETTLTATINTPPAEVGGVSGTSTALGPTTIMAGYAVGVRSEVTIPASIINKPLSFMVIPEYASTDFDVRICKVQLDYVGLGNPCTKIYQEPAKALQSKTWSKTSDTRKFDDVVNFDLGVTCPLNIEGEDSSNVLRLSFYMDLPPQDSIPSGEPIMMSSGLYVDDTALFTTIYNTTTSTTTLTAIEAYDSSQTFITPYLTARIMDETVDIGSIFGIRYVIKINKFTRGKIDFKVKVAEADKDNSKFCSIRVVQVGKNLGCAKLPEEYTRTSVSITDISATSTSVYREGLLEIDGVTNYGSDDLESNMYADDNSIEVLAFFKLIGNSATVNIDATLNGDTKTVTIQGSTNTSAAPTVDLDFQFISIDSDSIDSMHLLAPKTIAIEATIPKGYSGLIKVRVSDKDFSKKITLCGLFVTKVGKNLPCLSKAHEQLSTDSAYAQFYTDQSQPIGVFPALNETDKVELDDLGNPKYFKEMSLYLDVCHYAYTNNPAEDKIQVEFTFKANENGGDGETVTIEAEVITDKSLVKETTVTMSASGQPANLLVSNTTYPEVLDNTTTVIEAGNICK